MGKPTMRRSGQRHVTLRVRQDLDLDQLAHIFWAAANGGYYGRIEIDGFPQHPATAVRSAVMKYLAWNGWLTRATDDENFTGSAEAQRWAYEHAARAFGFNESEIPEPAVDEQAARRLAFYEDGGHPDDYDDENED